MNDKSFASQARVTSAVAPMRPPKSKAREKILTVETAAEVAAAARESGHTVVLAHGVFDVLHVGHLRHLEAASEEGDVLIVTITADTHVNKGPERPVFTEQLRAEMVAGLEYVDYVAINPQPTCENVIVELRPDVYVKGVEYAVAEDDVTGNIARERALVEKHGGRVVFTDNITFSSSTLINQHLDVYSDEVKEFFQEARQRIRIERIHELLDKVQDCRVLLVGDSIIDEYQYVRAMGKSPKDNMIATQFQEREIFAGGVVAAANHVASFCKEVEIITCVGDGEAGFEDFIRSSLKPNVRMSCVVRRDVPTTRKCRFIDTGYDMRKLFEVYFMDDQPIAGEEEQELLDLIADRARTYDVVTVTDFGHGLMSSGIVGAVADLAPFLAVNAQSNSANLGFNLVTKYPRADYICIDQPEARLAVGDNHADIETIVSEKLPSSIDCPRIIVTRGKHGCLAFNEAEGLSAIPALSSAIVDTVGAGDAFFSVSAPFVFAGASMIEAGLVGNAAGAMKVGIVGHRNAVEKIAFTKFVTALLK